MHQNSFQVLKIRRRHNPLSVLVIVWLHCLTNDVESLQKSLKMHQNCFQVLKLGIRHNPLRVLVIVWIHWLSKPFLKWSCVLIKCRPSWIHFFMNERLQKQIWRAFTHPTNALLCIFFVDIDSNGNPKMQISWVELGWSTIKHPLLKWFCFVNRKRRKLAIRRKRGNTRIQFICLWQKLTKLVNNSSLMAVLCHQEDKKCDNQGKLHCLWQQS